MFHAYRPSSLRTLTSVLLGFLLVAAPELAAAASPSHGASTSPAVRAGTNQGRHAVRAFERSRWFTAEHGVAHPLAATYLDRAGRLAVADRPGDRARVTLLDASSDKVVGRMRVPGLGDATTLADDGHGTLAALSGRRLLTWPARARGPVRPRVRQVTGVSLGRPAGMAWDATTRSWLVLDAAGRRLVRLTAHGAVVRASADPAPLSTTGAVRGLAVDPASGLIYLGVPGTEQLKVLTPTGTVHETLDLSDVAPASLRTLALGPTADPTDDPATTGLYLTDAGTTTGDDPVLGKVSGVSLTALGADAVPAATTSVASLVRSTPLWQLSPPVPDSSGVAYMSDKDRLIVVDSEVDEMTIFRGVNMWQISRTGSVLDTGTTHGDPNFSREPTGIGYDPVGRRVFISDDDKAKVFEVTTGPDNRFGTPDDVVSSFSTLAFGDDDAEDVAYDTKDKCLYVTQGEAVEVWRVCPGANGRFDGIAPTGDDQVSHFDTSAYGLTDLEGIGYSPTRDSLFLMDRKYTQVVEVTTSGALVQTIDVTAIKMNNPADITLAPATNDPSKLSMYVVTRGVDNDNHPDENDGMMYELSAPTLGPVQPGANTAPVVNAGPDSTVVLPATALLNGTVTDDGLPDPPGTTTATWTKVSGPGAVSFADNHAPRTTAGFSTTGSYVLRLSATDGSLTRADDVSITVTAANKAPVVQAGPDRTVTVPGPASLDGTVTDDGLPNPPGTTTATWTKVSGPGAVSFADIHAARTTATFTTPGSYVLRLAATDGALTGADETTVTVQPVNTAPTVDTGPDLVVRLPASLSIAATVTDDGLPTPADLRVSWEQVSGPGTATFTPPGRTSTEVEFSAPGSYQLRLRATDGALEATDTVSVTVQPAAQTLTLDCGCATRTVGAKVRLTGLLTRTVGELPLGGEAVTLRAYRAPQWRPVELGTVTTAADGWFTLTDSPRVTTRYVALSDQGTSTTVTVRVRPRLTGKLTRSRVHRGARTFVRGTVAPSDRGQLLLLQRWNGHGWVTQARHRMRHGAQVGYRFTLRVRKPGRHSYRVFAHAYHGRVGTATHTLVLHVRR